MSGHKKHLSDVEESLRRQPVFSSQRFDRPPSGANLSSRSRHSQTADELIAKMLNPGHSFHNTSQRRSSASENIQRDLALAEASFNPTDLLKEGLDEWHDRSLSIQLLKKSQSMTTARRQSILRRNPSKTSEGRRTSDASGGIRRASDASNGKPEDNVPMSQQLYPDSQPGTRHRYNYDFDQNDDMLTTANDDGTPMDVLPEFANILSSVPHATLIHLVMLYHQALAKNGHKEDADRIAKQLENIERADLQDMVAELSGIDLLLRDGLLRYLMSISPYLPTIPRQVVKFRDVGFVGTVQLDAGYESMYTKALDTIQGPLKKSPLERVTLLKDLTGYLMPGSLTLVVGTLGSGTSVIHSVLSGRAVGKGSNATGRITYNGRSIHDIKSRRLVSVVGSNDVHLGSFTVRETLEFARECSQYYRSHHYGDDLKEILGEALKAGQDPKLETNLSMLGLKRVADRVVGNPMVPGITEAERHRLTAAEMLAGTYAVYMFDQLNKGMDDSVAFDIITSIRIFTRVRSCTTLVSLIQPSPDVFDLFDRVIMLDRGNVVYQGPRKDILPYFENLGYCKPRQLTVPEFLEEVTTSDGAIFLRPGYPRLDIEGFVNEYKKSDQYKDILRVVDNPEIMEEVWVQGSNPLGVTFVQSHPNKGEGLVEPLTTLVASINDKGGSLVDVSMNHTGAIRAGDEVVAVGGSIGMLNYVKVGDAHKEGLAVPDQPTDCIRLQLERPLQDERAYDNQFCRNYVLDPWPEFLLLLDRELKTTWRNKLSLMIRVAQICILSFYIGFTFYQVHPDDQQLNFNLLKSTFFVSLLDMTLFNVGQLPGLMEERKIFYKQACANFYRPSSYVSAKIVGSTPFAMAEATFWSIAVYFLSNLSLNQGWWHFWVFYLIISLTVLNGNALVRFIAMFAPDLAAANGMIGLIVAIFIVFAGFLMPRFEVPHYWLWAYYLDPLQWGIASLMVNEFNSARYGALCSTLTPQQLMNFPQCNKRPNQTLGHAYLAKGQFYTGNHWIGISVAVLLGWFVLWNALTYFVASKIRHVQLTVITPSAEASFLRKSETIIDRDLEDQGPSLSLVATPVTLSWHELSYDILIPSVGKTLPLLSYVSGWAEPGELVGLVGATGAGKSILLNCLAGRGVQTARIGGQILVNGHPKNQLAFARISGYVDKLEAYSPYMTIREAIAFSSVIMLGKTTTAAERKQFVDEIVELMELRSVENYLVKSLGQSYLTSAESTRLRVATELARNASVIFIDSPTRNLDGRSTLHMVKILKKIAQTGRIVIVAMPMPTQRVVNCFTSVQILKRGGETVYWGPVGRDGELVKKYFEAIPGTPLCPPNICVTTFAIDVIGDGVQDRKAIKDYAFEYRVNELALHNHIQLQNLRRGKEILGPEVNDTGFGSSYFTRARNIITKLQLYYWRNVAYSWGRLFSSILTAILLGSIFFQQDWDTTPGMNTKASAIFISSLLQCISNAQAVLPQVSQFRPTYGREKASRQLNVFLYSIAWALGEVPYLAFSTLVYCAIFCGMSGLATGTPAAFFRYWFLLFELTLAITFFGMFLASASVLPQIAGTLVTIFTGFWVATSGVVVPKRKILPYFIWIFWTNPLQYALTAMTSLVFFCDTNGPDCQNGGLNAACLTDQTACLQCRCQRLTDTHKFVWDTIRYNRSLNYTDIKYDMLVLLGFIIVFRIATFVVWKYQTKKA